MPMNPDEMSLKKKLRPMELLWDDLCRNAPDFSSPRGTKTSCESERSGYAKEGRKCSTGIRPGSRSGTRCREKRGQLSMRLMAHPETMRIANGRVGLVALYPPLQGSTVGCDA
jgi:hypothetical protein